MSIPHSIFFVVDEPYCIWDIGLKERNLELLNSIDSTYFEHIARLSLDNSEDLEHKQQTATLLRISYYHGLETLFSYIGALIQAPCCVYAWLPKCNPGDVNTLVSRIDEGTHKLPSQLQIDRVDWNTIATMVCQYMNPDAIEQSLLTEKFATCWTRLADEYLRELFTLEYNAIKHGLRIRSGGHSLLIGREEEFGVAAPPENMKVLTHSDFGSTFFSLSQTPEKQKGNRTYRSRRHSINWSFDQTAAKLFLISLSITNILNIIKIINGVPPETLKFANLVHPDAFEFPWSTSTSHSTSTFDYTYKEGWTTSTTKKQLLDAVKAYSVDDQQLPRESHE